RFSSVQLRSSRSDVLWPIQAELLSGRDPLFRSITVELTQFSSHTSTHSAKTSASTATRATAACWHASRRSRPPASSGLHACTCIMRRTSQHSRKKEQKERYSEYPGY